MLYIIVVIKTGANKELRRYRLRWESNITIHLKDKGLEASKLDSCGSQQSYWATVDEVINWVP
jgi:hypothetical protein